jgi:paraquat-inducible protein B
MLPTRPAAVGGFLLGGMAIVVAAILFFGGGEMFAVKTKAVVFFEGSVGGLVQGAPVTFRGVRVGSVSHVVLVLDPGDMQARIPVYLELEPRQVTFATGTAGQPLLRRLIEAGLRAKLVSQSLVTGQMLVELDLSPGTPAHLAGGGDSKIPEIPALPSDIEELRQQLTQAPIAETVAQALRTLAAIEKVADQVSAKVAPLAESAQRVLDNAGRTIDIAGAAVQHVERDATSTLDEARGLGRDGRQQFAARGAEVSRTLGDADKALGDVNKTLQAVNGLVLSTTSLIAPRSQARDDLEATLRDLSASASALRDISQTIDRDPSVVLRGRASR